ncbi:MAG: META domain-containing protein [Chloroflexota bacterium]
MKTKQTLLVMSLLIMSLLLVACGQTNEPGVTNGDTAPAATDDTAAGLANPASVYCEEQGGTLEIRTDNNGGQYGVCLFDDGSECDEWAFFRGECAPSSIPLFETLWVLQSYGGQSPVAGTVPTLKISSDGQLSGSTGCNTFFSNATIDGNTWQVGEVGSTMMACIDDGLMEQETAVIDLLSSVISHTLSNGQLTLHSIGGDLVYVPASNTALEGTTWTLNGIAQDEAIVSTWIDTDVTLLLSDGKLSGYTGCNDYFGSYTVDGSAVTFSAIGQTRRACDEEHGQREMELMAALAQVAAYRTELNTLTLLDENGRSLLTMIVTQPAS